MLKLLLLPDSEGYQSTEGAEVIMSELDGGAGRYRRDKIGATKRVQVKWSLDPAAYQYWRAFYNTGTQKGALAFLCDLVSEDGYGPQEHICNFIPGSVSLPSQVGLTYVQQATLEVRPRPVNTALDETIIALYGTYGDGALAFLLSLEKLVNVTLPENLNA